MLLVKIFCQNGQIKMYLLGSDDKKWNVHIRSKILVSTQIIVPTNFTTFSVATVAEKKIKK